MYFIIPQGWWQRIHGHSSSTTWPSTNSNWPVTWCKMDGILKVTVFLSFTWTTALLYIFIVTRAEAPRELMLCLTCTHARHIQGSFRSSLLNWYACGERTAMGNPCDRSRCWTLIPSRGSLATTSLSSPALLSARLCLEERTNDSRFPELDCLHHFLPHPCLLFTQAWVRPPSFGLSVFFCSQIILLGRIPRPSTQSSNSGFSNVSFLFFLSLIFC